MLTNLVEIQVVGIDGVTIAGTAQIRFNNLVDGAGVAMAVDELLPVGDSDVALVVRPRFVIPGSDEGSGGFVARMPGKVIDLRVAVGDRVSAGDTLVVLEAMKMEHPMRAPEDGVVTEVRVSAGDQVEAGTLLLVVGSGEGADGDGAQGES